MGISKYLRKKISIRANYRCEYCLVNEVDSFLPFQIDHIIAQKHGGGIEDENLALSCPHCNQHKGTDLTTFLDSYEDIVSLFHPRKEDWADHFIIESGEIIPLTKTGEATVKLLQFNTPERLIYRRLLMEKGFYP